MDDGEDEMMNATERSQTERSETLVASRPVCIGLRRDRQSSNSDAKYSRRGDFPSETDLIKSNASRKYGQISTVEES